MGKDLLLVVKVYTFFFIILHLNFLTSSIKYLSLYYLWILGGDSGRVVIWNMEPVVDETAELDSNVPKMLCQLDNHLGKHLIFFVLIRN